MILRSYIVDLFCILIFVLIPPCYSRGLLYELSGLSDSARIAVYKKLNEIETGLESGESFKNRRLLSNRIQSDSNEESANEIPSKNIENLKKDQKKEKQLISTINSAKTGKGNIPYTKKTYPNKATRTTKNEAEDEARFYPFFKMDDATTRKAAKEPQTKEISKFLRYIHITPTSRIFSSVITNSESSEYFEEVTERMGLKGHDSKPYVTPDPPTDENEEKSIVLNKKSETETNDFIRSTRCSTASLLPKLDATYKPNETVSNEISSKSSESVEVLDKTYVPPEPAQIPKHFVDDEK